MKKLILTLFASAALVSCSTDSSSDNPSSGGLLVKTITYNNLSFFNQLTYSYNGNKFSGYIDSSGGYGTITYNGNYIINTGDFSNNSTYLVNYNYANGLLISTNTNSTFNNSSNTRSSTFVHNSDGSITENETSTSNTGYVSHSMTKRYYSQGNCIKEEYFSIDNSVMYLTSITNYTYDTKNNPFKNAIGWSYLVGVGFDWGMTNNNVISEITTNDSGVVESTSQSTYQYNSQDYPISCVTTNNYYNFDPTTGISTPGTPSTETQTYTYY